LIRAEKASDYVSVPTLATKADWAGERLGLCRSSRPASLGANGYLDSFNSRIRNECLNINILWSLTQAHVVISD
jgi:putative transposase